MFKHFDILWELQSLKYESKTTLDSRHVKGSQSRLQCDRDHLARLNSDADCLAKEFLSRCISDSTIHSPLLLGGKHWSLILQGQKIVKNINASIVNHIHGSELRAHICLKNNWEREELDYIDWQSIERVSRYDSASDNLWKMKMASGFVPVGTRMLLCKQWKNAKCPRCQRCDEDVQHLLSCQELGALLTRKLCIRNIIEWMRRSNTDPDITATVIGTLNSTTSGRFSDHLPLTANQDLISAAIHQDRLGPLSLFKGYISSHWRRAQSSFWESIQTNVRRSPNQWSCQFLRLWLSFAKDLWSHCNDFLHHKSNLQKRQEREMEVNVSVVAQFGKGVEGLMEKDVHLINDTNIETVLSMDVKKKTQWVDNKVSTRRKRARVESTEMARMRRFLRDWRIQENGS